MCGARRWVISTCPDQAGVFLTIPKVGCILPDMGRKRNSRKPPQPRHSSVADALFSKGRQRVLAVLFGNPGRSFYASEIIALASSGTGAVQRELARLENAGLVTARRVGNQKHYQANPEAPVFEELRGVVLKTSGLADVLRAALDPLTPDIRAAFVYGSIARREDTATSDIDLLVISDKLTYAELFSGLEKATRRLGRRVNPTVYTTAEFARRIRQGNAFVRGVLAEPKIWLIGGERDLAS
jgi:predicted nucleotidyltransferase